MAEVTFDLRLKDYMSGMLPKVQATARSVFGGVDKIVQNTQRNLGELGKRVGLNVDTSSLKAASSEVDSLQRKLRNIDGGTSGGGGGISLGRIAGGAFIGNMAMQGAREVSSIGASAFGNGVQLENMKVGLDTFVGNGKGDAIVEKILKQAFYTPFTTQVLEPIEQGFIATGIEEKRANRDMLNLANAVAATGGNDFILSRIGSDMMGGAAKGTIQGRELMELQRTAHINIASLIAKDKFSNLPLKDGLRKVEDMDISFADFESALDKAAKSGGMFDHAMERLSQTIGGKNSTIKDMWWNLGAKLTESQSGPIKRIQDGIINGLSDIPGILERMTPILNSVFETVSELWPSVKSLAGSLFEAVKPIGGFLLSDGFRDLAKSVIDIAGELTNALKPAIDAFVAGLNVMTYAIKPWADAIAKMGKKDDGGYHGAVGILLTDTDSLGAKGYKVNDDSLNNIKGRINAFGGDVHFFNRRKDIDSFNYAMYKRYPSDMSKQIGPGGLTTLPIPFLTDKEKAGKKGIGAAAAVGDVADKIIGGGQKQVTINLNAPLYRVDKQVFQNVKDAITDFEPKIQEAVWRIFRTLPVAQ